MCFLGFPYFSLLQYHCTVLRIQECLSSIPDMIFSIPDPGLTRSWIRICIKEFKYLFLTQKTDNKFSKIRSRMFILDPGSGFFSIPDKVSKKHRILQCCGSGSGIRCLFDPWIGDPGWVEVSIRIRDPG
jgi:hypothetical protein